MRLAVLTDIHGNSTALEAVLADLATLGTMDHIWVLGDLAVFGPDPAGSIRLIRDLPNAKTIEGNTDRYLRTGLRPPMFPPTAEHWEKLAEKTRLRDLAFTWALERMAWEDMEFLTKLGRDLSLEVDDYGWVIGFHAVPGDDEAMSLVQTASDHEMRDALLDREGNLALCGHTHEAFDRDLGTWRLVNPGSVGMPFDGDPRAAYAVLTFENGQVQVDLRRVAFDIEAVIAQLETQNYPLLKQATTRLRTGTRG